jgi:hypothetical protein
MAPLLLYKRSACFCNENFINISMGGNDGKCSSVKWPRFRLVGEMKREVNGIFLHIC